MSNDFNWAGVGGLLADREGVKGVLRGLAAFAIVGLLTALGGVLAPAHAQSTACLQGGDYIPADMGVPGAQGVNESASMTDAGQKLGYTFRATQDRAASLYIGDQWFDLDLFLYVQGQCPAGSWESLVRSWSVRGEQRVIQFIRPNEQIVNIKAGNYLLLAGHSNGSDPRFISDFDPSHGFTVRVALNSPYCGLDPADQPVPNPVNPAVTMLKRPDDALYQLGITIDPPVEQDRGPFALLTFTAFVSPPYTDLYDFAWRLDGADIPGADGAILQMAQTELPKTTGGQHTIQVDATGARVYPDPEQPSIPPNLTTSCNFKVAG